MAILSSDCIFLLSNLVGENQELKMGAKGELAEPMLLQELWRKGTSFASRLQKPVWPHVKQKYELYSCELDLSILRQFSLCRLPVVYLNCEFNF